MANFATVEEGSVIKHVKKKFNDRSEINLKFSLQTGVEVKAACIEIINYFFALLSLKKFTTESNLLTFNENFQAAFSQQGLSFFTLPQKKKSKRSASLTIPASNRRENLVSELQKSAQLLFNFLLFLTVTRHGKHELAMRSRGGEGKSWKKKLSEIHAGSRGKETMGKASYDGKQK